MDLIHIDTLNIETIIGVLPWERKIPQNIHVDLSYDVDAQNVSSDELKDVIDYRGICEKLTSFIQSAKCQLLETLAQKCCQFLFSEFGLNFVRLKITKLGALENIKAVSITVERQK